MVHLKFSMFFRYTVRHEHFTVGSVERYAWSHIRTVGVQMISM